jgi:DNA anti-recombination protein RmuC
VERTREQIHSTTDEIVARAAQIREQMNTELQPLLTPQQRQRLAHLEQILERSRERARERGAGSDRISP